MAEAAAPDELTPEWDVSYIGISFLLASLGADTALFLIDMARTDSYARQLSPKREEQRRHVPWLFLAAVALGGCGIWCMHFAGMAAMTIPGVSLRYDTLISVSSLVAAIAVTYVAFRLVLPVAAESAARRSHNAVFSEQAFAAAADILSAGVSGARNPRIVGAGFLLGIAADVMHFSGMLSARMNGASQTLSMDMVAVSLVIGVIVAWAALVLVFELTDTGARRIAPILMGLGVTGLHYTGMMAATIHRHDGWSGPDAGLGSLSGSDVAIAIAVTSVTTCFALQGMVSQRIAAEKAHLDDLVGHIRADFVVLRAEYDAQCRVQQLLHAQLSLIRLTRPHAPPKLVADTLDALTHQSTSRRYPFSDKDPIDGSIEAMLLVLEDPAACESLKDEAARVHCADSVLFLNAVHCFKSAEELDEKSNDQRNADARRIVANFIAVDSPQEVNISSVQRASTTHAVETMVTGKTMSHQGRMIRSAVFDVAFAEVSRLLYENVWVRFVQTDAARGAIALAKWGADERRIVRHCVADAAALAAAGPAEVHKAAASRSRTDRLRAAGSSQPTLSTSNRHPITSAIGVSRRKALPRVSTAPLRSFGRARPPAWLATSPFHARDDSERSVTQSADEATIGPVSQAMGGDSFFTKGSVHTSVDVSDDGSCGLDFGAAGVPQTDKLKRSGSPSFSGSVNTDPVLVVSPRTP